MRIIQGRGSYLLIIELAEHSNIRIGCLGEIYFEAGGYVYVGSALRGFKTRLPHHLRGSARPRWHIDYLLRRAQLTGLALIENRHRQECDIAGLLQANYTGIRGFGCSDCGCRSHLFYTGRLSGLKTHLVGLLKQYGFQAVSIPINQVNPEGFGRLESHLNG